MGKQIVIAGIGTDVGKTIASAIVCEALKADYWKPIQAGDLDHGDKRTVKNLISNHEAVFHPEAYLLKTPASPHLSAALDQVVIDSQAIDVPEVNNDLVIEMAGGLMVPLNDKELFIDWVENKSLPVILVASYYLGSINHTLLTISELKRRNVPIKGIIYNGAKVDSTFDIIQRHHGLKVLLEIKHENEFNPEVVSAYAKKLKPIG